MLLVGGLGHLTHRTFKWFFLHDKFVCTVLLLPVLKTYLLWSIVKFSKWLYFHYLCSCSAILAKTQQASYPSLTWRMFYMSVTFHPPIGSAIRNLQPILTACDHNVENWVVNFRLLNFLHRDIIFNETIAIHLRFKFCLHPYIYLVGHISFLFFLFKYSISEK